MNKSNIWTIIVFIVLICVATFSRMLPHEFNFSPIGAIALFSGFYFGFHWKSFVLPLAILYISDYFIHLMVLKSEFGFFYAGWYWQLLSYLIIALMGHFMIKKFNFFSIAFAGLTSAILFFLISNFGSWLVIPNYTKDFEGLKNCFVAALPFFRGTVSGFLVYSFILFGFYGLMAKKFNKVEFFLIK